MKIALIILFFVITGSLREEYKKVSDKNIEEILGSGEIKLIGNESGKEYFSFESENSNGGSMVVFSSAKGRYENFDYMVITNSSVEILNIKILKYRSEYGYEISNKGWLKQFYKNPDSRFEYRKNISALSGATFSAPSLVDDINIITDQLKKYRITGDFTAR